MTRNMLLGISVAVLVVGVAAVASARSNSEAGWMSVNDDSTAEMTMMTDEATIGEMMPGMMAMMDSDHVSEMVGYMGADHVSEMMTAMAAHHAEMTEMTGMMPGADSGMMDSGRSMGIDHDGHHSP